MLPESGWPIEGEQQYDTSSENESFQLKKENMNCLFMILKADVGTVSRFSTAENSDCTDQPQNRLPPPLFRKIANKDNKFSTQYDEHKKILVLDLDETLLHSFKQYPRKPSKVVPVKIKGNIRLFYVIKRPGLDEFLEELKEYFNLCIYTSSEEEYARDIMESVGIGKYFFGLYSRKHCYQVSENVFVKNLSSLGFPQEKTIFLDDFPLQMKNQPKNGIIIKRFFDDEKDQELERLAPFLKHISKYEDVTPVAKHLFEFFAEEKQAMLDKIISPTLPVAPRRSFEIETSDTDMFPNLIQSGSQTDRIFNSLIKNSPKLISLTHTGKTNRFACMSNLTEGNDTAEFLNAHENTKKIEFFMISKKPLFTKLAPKH